MENVMMKINGVECSVPKGSTILEAARIAALRGHDVTLYDDREELGGRLILAGLPPHKRGYTEAVEYLSQVYQVDMPICHTVYNILYNKEDPLKALKNLFDRSIKSEF